MIPSQIVASLFLFGLPLLLTAAEPDALADFSSYDIHQGKRYDFAITEEVLSRTPPWRTDEEFPPLSPRKAEGLAREQLKRLVEEPESWTRTEIVLQHIEGDRWVYVIEFMGDHPPGVIDGPVSTMKLVVLMNGTAVDPKISSHGNKN
jgi:hypothetical protein